MIDLELAEKNFHEYVAEYPNVPRIKLKEEHIIRVMQISINLAKQLKLSKEDVKLAGLIGLMHDIGRFEQAKVYDTFDDKVSINHAVYSSMQLFEKGLIRRFIQDDTYDYIIKKAVENHNKFQIEEGLDERTLLHCKIIRDSDKCDIYEQIIQSDAKLVFDGPYNKENVFEKKVLDDFYHYKGINSADMKTVLDDYVRKAAFAYGLYFKESLYYIKERDYTNRLTKKFEETFEFVNENTKKEIKKINNFANEYIDKMVKNKNNI